jgi:NTP pyrophosphatase (non-canonical NTP hydrolase)
VAAEPFGFALPVDCGPVELTEFQEVIRRTFVARDRERGIDGTFRWMVEEVGELAKALRNADPAELTHEVGDVIAWLASVANLAGVDLETAASRYANGCPRCGQIPCACPMR